PRVLARGDARQLHPAEEHHRQPPTVNAKTPARNSVRYPPTLSAYLFNFANATPSEVCGADGFVAAGAGGPSRAFGGGAGDDPAAGSCTFIVSAMRLRGRSTSTTLTLTMSPALT